MTGYWPWWLTATALGSITVGYWIAVRRPLGVSGVLSRFTRVREELEFDRGVAVVNDTDQAAIEAQLLAMTLEAFGPLPATASGAPMPSVEPVAAAAPGHVPMEPARHEVEEGRTCAPVPSLGTHLTFLAMLAVGGLLAALLRGPVSIQLGFGEEFHRFFGAGAAGPVVLAGGGLLVGFGTAMCGGCSAGHGLTGSARLFPGSLLSTAIFFGTAIAVSLLLCGVLS